MIFITTFLYLFIPYILPRIILLKKIKEIAYFKAADEIDNRFEHDDKYRDDPRNQHTRFPFRKPHPPAIEDKLNAAIRLGLLPLVVALVEEGGARYDKLGRNHDPDDTTTLYEYETPYELAVWLALIEEKKEFMPILKYLHKQYLLDNPKK